MRIHAHSYIIRGMAGMGCFVVIILLGLSVWLGPRPRDSKTTKHWNALLSNGDF